MKALLLFYGILFLVISSYALPQVKPNRKPKPSEEDDYYSDEEEEQLPKTSFSCDGKIDGFYADIEANCRVYHYCQTIMYPDDTDERKDWAFFCPPTTIFRQEYLTCTRPHKSFKCSESENYFDVNEKLPTVPPGEEPTTPQPPTSLPPDDDDDTSESNEHESEDETSESNEHESDDETSSTTTSEEPTTETTTTTTTTTKKPHAPTTRRPKPPPHHPGFLLPPLPAHVETLPPIMPYSSSSSFDRGFKPLWWYFFSNGNQAQSGRRFDILSKKLPDATKVVESPTNLRKSTWEIVEDNFFKLMNIVHDSNSNVKKID